MKPLSHKPLHLESAQNARPLVLKEFSREELPQTSVSIAARSGNKGGVTSVFLSLLLVSAAAGAMALLKTAYDEIAERVPEVFSTELTVQELSPPEPTEVTLPERSELPVPEQLKTIPVIATQAVSYHVPQVEDFLESEEFLLEEELPPPPPVAKPQPQKKEAKPKRKATPKAKPAKKSKSDNAASERRAEEKRRRDAAKRQAALARKIVQKAGVVSRATPVYPKSARRKGIEGKVVVTVTVSPSGKVSSAVVSRSSGNGSLDKAAVNAARRYRFSPAKNGLGQSVTAKKAIPFSFRLS